MVLLVSADEGVGRPTWGEELGREDTPQVAFTFFAACLFAGDHASKMF